METLIYLVRHTEPIAADNRRRYLGRSDPPLSPLGLRQAREVARSLSHQHFDSIHSSDLSRALQTAQIIAEALGSRPGTPDLTVHTDARFREIDVGLWEGLTFEEAKERYPNEYAQRELDLYHNPFPGGESFAQVRARALAALREVLARGDSTILLVAHKGVNRVLLCELLRLPPERLFSLPQEYGAVNKIRVAGI